MDLICHCQATPSSLHSVACTQMADFVAYSIIQGRSVSARVNAMEKWVSVAESCLELKNFPGILQVMLGLMHTATGRLHRTADQLSAKVRRGRGRGRWRGEGEEEGRGKGRRKKEEREGGGGGRKGARGGWLIICCLVQANLLSFLSSILNLSSSG